MAVIQHFPLADHAFHSRAKKMLEGKVHGGRPVVGPFVFSGAFLALVASGRVIYPFWARRYFSWCSDLLERAPSQASKWLLTPP